jgi:hypothetical protein
VCWKLCSSCRNFHLLREEFLSTPIHSPLSGSPYRSFKGEDLGNVEADLKDLVTAKQSKFMPASFVFGESKVTTNVIREYEAASYFPAGDGRAPLDEQVPTPTPDEVVVF